MNQTLLEKTVEERHAELREKARKQGVKPIQRIEDLYGDFADDVDIDEFLEMVREIRNEGKNGASNE
ncbi:MAG: hypothetical protein H0X72_02785 [Acidobacteria bacterium]|jgi:hypothetical protein|nr:hypothetical protein [Acidobacteriota bacterium]MBA4184785.1 hypothetical protein [Acidobacteriota bacterium]HEV8157925.1 hypothetical protein [Pyrinomonadaceae bacterium]